MKVKNQDCPPNGDVANTFGFYVTFKKDSLGVLISLGQLIYIVEQLSQLFPRGFQTEPANSAATISSQDVVFEKVKPITESVFKAGRAGKRHSQPSALVRTPKKPEILVEIAS